MKLLFDQNLSPRLIDRLDAIFPGSAHTHLAGLDRATDEDVWTFATSNGFTLVTKDADFDELATLRGAPPKVVWVRLGNCTTGQVEDVLRRFHEQILDFERDPEAVVLALGTDTGP